MGFPFPFDFSSLFNKLKENIDVTKDGDAIIIKFKEVAPGVSMDMLKDMIENAMSSKGKNPFDLLSNAGSDDDDDANAEDDGGDDEDGSYEPGFKVESLEDGTGLKLIPDDPDDIDEFYNSITQLFDPEMFKEAMSAAFKMLGNMLPGFGNMFGGDDGSNADGENAGEDSNKKTKKKPGGDDSDSTMSPDYFYT